MAGTNNYSIWALNVLPIVFDDYVSQKDLFVKMVRYINGLIGDTVTLYNDFTAMDTGTIGDLEDLHTTEKGSIVGAINEVKDEADSLKEDITNLQEEQIPIDAPFYGSLSGNKIEDKVPYLFRKCPDGIREDDTIVGASVAWNQLVQNGNFSDGSTSWVARLSTLTVSNGIATVVPDSTGTERGLQQNISSPPKTIANHKYLLTVDFCTNTQTNLKLGFAGSNSVTVTVPTVNVWQTCSAIWTAYSAINQLLTAYTSASVSSSATLQYKNACAFDLTQMLGSTIADYVYSLETATAGAGVAWLRSHGFITKPYYAYDAGSLKSVCVSGHKTVGFNQWDEEWELGGIDDSTGQKIDVATQIRSKNYIKCVPNTAYYATSPVAGAVYIYYYDADGSYIGRASHISTGYNVANKEFTTPSNCQQLMMKYQQNYVTSYNHDICINISDPIRNGEYEPYEAHTYALDSTKEFRGVFKLDSGNKLYADGDVYKADGSVTRKTSTYTFTGNETWTWNESNSLWWTEFSISSAWKSGGFVRCSNGVICYLTGTPGLLRVLNSSNTQITSSTNMNTLFASGTLLMYELATPTTETANPFQSPQICDPSGTEEYLDTRTVQVPLGHDTIYYQSMRSYVDKQNELMDKIITANREISMKATTAYTSGALIIVNGKLYKATTSIANGATLTVGTNVTATTIAAELAALA